MTRTKRFVTMLRLLLVGASAVALGAGCSNGHDGPPDLGAIDLASAGDLATQPMVLTGSSLVAGAGLGVIDLTSDDLVVYGDGKSALYAVPAAGGQPVLIDSASAQVSIRNRAVFSWSSYDPKTNLGALTVYTAATGPVRLASGSIGISQLRPSGLGAVGFSSAASPDGRYIAWTGNADTSGTTASVFVGTPDGKTMMEVIKGRSTNPDCLPTMAWWKDAFVVGSCGEAGDAGVTPATIHLVDPQTFSVTELVSGVRAYLDIDDAGTMLFTIDTSGNGIVKMRGEMPPTVIESGVVSDFFDDDAVIYVTKSGALKRWTLNGTTTLVPSSVGDLLALGKSSILFSSKTDDSTGLTDLFITSKTAPMTPYPLVKDPTVALFGPPFTADDNFVLYYQDVDNDGTGTLTARALPTGGGGQARTIAQRVWLSLPGTGQKVIYNDNFVATSDSSGYADLKVIDLAGPPAPTVIAHGADPDFFVTAARDRVVFSVNQVKGKEGVYVAPVL